MEIKRANDVCRKTHRPGLNFSLHLHHNEGHVIILLHTALD